MSFVDLAKEADTAVKRQQVRTAIAYYEEILRRHPEHSLYSYYQLGVINQVLIGDGDKARLLFGKAVEMADRQAAAGQPGNLWQSMKAYTCENLMLLSLSYDEYDTWAKQLEELSPNEAILRHQRPTILDMRNRGHPWAVALDWIAHSYFHAESSQDPAGYGYAASIYQLMLTHRRELRLSRERWRNTAYLYAATIISLVSSLGLASVKAVGTADPDEFMFIVEAALPLVEKYAGANPSDENGRLAVQNLRKSIAHIQSAAGSEPIGQPTGQGDSHRGEGREETRRRSPFFAFWRRRE